VVTRLRETLAAGEREHLKATVKELLRVRTIVYVSATRRSGDLTVRETEPAGPLDGLLILAVRLASRRADRARSSPMRSASAIALNGASRRTATTNR